MSEFAGSQHPKHVVEVSKSTELHTRYGEGIVDDSLVKPGLEVRAFFGSFGSFDGFGHGTGDHLGGPRTNALL